MTISLKTHKMLWGRSANICAFPDCKKVLVIDETLTDDPSVIGEEAHIVARKNDGPRGISELSEDQRDKYHNLILLCSIHHKLVDDQYVEYNVEKLHNFKTAHEKWVLQNLLVDSKKIKDDELYVSYVEYFIKETDLNNWTNWSSWILGSSETFPKERYDKLRELSNYIVSRIWSKRYPELEHSLINFKNVSNDLVRVFDIYLQERKNSYGIERFYRNTNQGEEVYFQLIKKYEYHVALVEDLLIELTRAANYVCDRVREYLMEGFRLTEGAILITRGDIMGYKSFRVEYRNEERTSLPYKGLKDFMTARQDRDFAVGEGIEEDYFRETW